MAEDAKNLVRELFESYNARKGISAMDVYFGDGYASHNEDIPPGLTGTRQFFAMLRTGFPDSEFAIDELRTEGEKVIATLTFKGTHEGDVWGFAPTGKQVSVTSTDTWRVAEGRLVEHWGGLTKQALSEQLGIQPT